MEVKYIYKDIIDRCEQLSAFEAEGKFDANGESRFLELHINEVDRALAMQYLMQACSVLEERMARMIESVEHIETVVPTLPQEYTVFYEQPIPSDYHPNPSLETLVYHYEDHAFYYQEMEGVVFVNFNVPTGIYKDHDTGKFYVVSEEGKKKEYSTDPIEGHFVWHIRTDTRWKDNGTFRRHVAEAIVSYIMAEWLRPRIPERAAFYEALFASSTSFAVKNIFTKTIPV